MKLKFIRLLILEKAILSLQQRKLNRGQGDVIITGKCMDNNLRFEVHGRSIQKPVNFNIG